MVNRPRVHVLLARLYPVRARRRPPSQPSASCSLPSRIRLCSLTLRSTTTTDYLVVYGTFDEKQIGRDRTPDKSVKHLAIGIVGESRRFLLFPVVRESPDPPRMSSVHVCTDRDHVHAPIRQERPTSDDVQLGLPVALGRVGGRPRLLFREFPFLSSKTTSLTRP